MGSWQIIVFLEYQFLTLPLLANPSPACHTLHFMIIITFIIHRFYIALFSALKPTRCAYVEWVTASFFPFFFIARFSISNEVVYWQRNLLVIWLVPRETAAVSAHVMCTPYNHAPVSSVTTLKKYIGMMHVSLAVTCHLHFSQNDRDRLRTTAVTRGGTNTETTVSTERWPSKGKFSRRSCRDSNPGPFDHESGELSPLR